MELKAGTTDEAFQVFLYGREELLFDFHLFNF